MLSLYPVKDNPLGNVVLIGSRYKSMQQFIEASLNKSIPPALRLYGNLLHTDLKIPGHKGPLPNVEFLFWKLHLPDDPDIMPNEKRIFLDPDAILQPIGK